MTQRDPVEWMVVIRYKRRDLDCVYVRARTAKEAKERAMPFVLDRGYDLTGPHSLLAVKMP